MKCFENNDNRFIDLYYNDAHCLMGTINEEKKKNNKIVIIN
jgi:hypothetical protein